MKLNNLTRLTALLLALFLLPMTAGAESIPDSIALNELTSDVLKAYDAVTGMVAADYCETCAKDVASAGLTQWPNTDYNCLYTQLKKMSPSRAYDMLIGYYNAGTTEGDALYDAYINSHNNHVINAAGSSDSPAVICDGCSYLVLQPGAEGHAESCPWYDKEYTQAVAGLNPVYGEDGVTIESYILMLNNANGELVTVATSKILDDKYHYFQDINTGWYVAYLHEVTNEDGTVTQWIIPLPSEKDLEETPAN